MRKRYIYIYIDILRIVATFAVIILHVAAMNWYHTDIRSFEWNVFNFYDSIVRWGVPVFTMISGALFLSNENSIGVLYKKYILRIFVATIFWSIIYAVYSYIQNTNLSRAAMLFVKGRYHMWFLYMIIGMYAAVPILKKIVEDKRLLRYFLTLGLIFAFVLPQLQSILKVFPFKYSNFIVTYIANFKVPIVMGFSFYYVLGYYLNEEALRPKTKRIIKICGWLGLLVTILLTTITSVSTNKANALFYDNFTINVLAQSVLVFMLFKDKFSKLELDGRLYKSILVLSKYSFGAYLVHILIIDMLRRYCGIHSLSFNPALSVPLISLLVFLISISISGTLNQIPVIRKYIV